MISQITQFMGATAHALYTAYMSSAEHSAMTLDGTYAATFRRPGEGDVASGRPGDQLLAIGARRPDGEPQYAVDARILELVPDRLIVHSWKNKDWPLAVDQTEATDLPSTLVLTFRDNFMGAELQLDQINIPNYNVSIAETGEVGPLSEIVNRHWNIVYWDPMRRYFDAKVRAVA
jgi:hypothetical protein